MATGNYFEYVEYTGRVLALAFHANLIGGAPATIFGLSLFIAILLVLVWLATGLILRRLVLEDAMLQIYVLSSVLAFAALTAIGRVCLGLDSAWASRYYLYCAPLLVLFIIFLAKQARGQKSGFVIPVIIIITLLALNVPYQREYREWFQRTAEGKRRWLACITSGATAFSCDLKAGFKVHPSTASIEGRINQFVTHLKK